MSSTFCLVDLVWAAQVSSFVLQHDMCYSIMSGGGAQLTFTTQCE